MSYTISEIIRNVIGVNENGNPKTAVSFNLSKIDEERKEIKDTTEVSFCNAEVKITKVGSFVTLDLVFINKFSSELNRLWSILELYGKTMTDLENFDENTAINGVFTVMPMALNGKAFISAVNPVYWTLMATKPTDEINTIRILFNDINFNFLEGPEIDMDLLRESIEQEIRKEEDEAQRIANRMEEEEEYQQLRNEKIENLRNRPNFNETPLQRKRREEIEKQLAKDNDVAEE